MSDVPAKAHMRRYFCTKSCIAYSLRNVCRLMFIFIFDNELIFLRSQIAVLIFG